MIILSMYLQLSTTKRIKNPSLMIKNKQDIQKSELIDQSIK